MSKIDDVTGEEDLGKDTSSPHRQDSPRSGLRVLVSLKNLY